MADLAEDLSVDFIEEKEKAEFTETEEFMRRRLGSAFTPKFDLEEVSEQEEQDPDKDVDKPRQIVPAQPDEDPSLIKSAGAFVADIGEGAIESPLAVIRGLGKASQSLFDFIDEVLEAVGEKTGINDLENAIREKLGVDPLDPSATVADIEVTGIPASADSVTGGLIASFAQFLFSFGAAGKLLKGLGKVSTGPQRDFGQIVLKTTTGSTKLSKAGKATEALVKGSLAEAIGFDATEESLINLLNDFPLIKGDVTAFLESTLGVDEEDPALLNRLKRGLTDGGVGVVFEAFIGGLRFIKVFRANRKALQQDLKLAEADKVVKEVDKIVKEATPEELSNLIGDATRPLIDISPEDLLKARKTGKFAGNINLGKIKSPLDIDKVITAIEEAITGGVKGSKKVQTHKQTKKLAKELGLTIEELLSRAEFSPERIVAARTLLAASAEKVFVLAKVAENGSVKDLVAFRQALNLHAAVQQNVSGLAQKAGRTLNAFGITVSSIDEQVKLLKEMISSGGGEKLFRDMAKKMSQFGSDLSPQQLNAVIRGSPYARTRDAFLEVWINGLLSNPATQVVNMMGSAMAVVGAVAERQIAGSVSALTGGKGVRQGEALAQLYGIVAGAREGFFLMLRTLRTGEVSDVFTKNEIAGRRHLSAEAAGLAGPIGQFVDFIGLVIRSPGRTLLAVDEFFKAVGYRMELNALAYRKGIEEGLDGEDLAKRMMDIIYGEADQGVKLEAKQVARYQTFTKELGPLGQLVQQGINAHPWFRLIAPFVRTPLNLIKYAGERTPFAFMSPAVQREFKAGGARKQLALAKIATGSTILAMTADAAGQGLITGNGPVDPRQKAIWLVNHQPNSFKYNGQWYAYSRTDPIGILMGISADFAEIAGHLEEEDLTTLGLHALGAVTGSMTNKTYLRGVADFSEIIFAQGEEISSQKFAQFLGRFAATAVPFSSLGGAINRVEDPVFRNNRDATSLFNTFANEMRAKIPGYAADVPPVRNVLGDIIHLNSGWSRDMISPVYTNTVDGDFLIPNKDFLEENLITREGASTILGEIGEDIASMVNPIYIRSATPDPVAEEVFQQGVPVSWPEKNIDGIPLRPLEQDRYEEVAGKNLRKILGVLFDSPGYQNASPGRDGIKGLLIKQSVQQARAMAKVEILTSVDFKALGEDRLSMLLLKANTLVKGGRVRASRDDLEELSEKRAQGRQGGIKVPNN